MRSRPGSSRPAGGRKRCCRGDGGTAQIALQAGLCRRAGWCASPRFEADRQVLVALRAEGRALRRHSVLAWRARRVTLPAVACLSPAWACTLSALATPGHLLCMTAQMWPTLQGVPVHDAAASLLRLLMQHAGPESSMPPLCRWDPMSASTLGLHACGTHIECGLISMQP